MGEPQLLSTAHIPSCVGLAGGDRVGALGQEHPHRLGAQGSSTGDSETRFLVGTWHGPPSDAEAASPRRRGWGSAPPAQAPCLLRLLSLARGRPGFCL